MLRIVRTLRELSFSSLMDVYAESNQHTAVELWPNLPEGFAVQLAEQDFRQYLQEVFFHTSDAVYAIWEEQGKYTSALRLEPYRDGLLLEALETAPHERRKGYAKALLQAVVLHFDEKKLFSHVDKRNTASLTVHKRCGFQIIQDYAVYIDGSVNHRCCTLCYHKKTTE